MQIGKKTSEHFKTYCIRLPVASLLAPPPRRALAVPWIEQIPPKHLLKSYANHCFVINDHVDHEFSHGTYLEDLDCSLDLT